MRHSAKPQLGAMYEALPSRRAEYAGLPRGDAVYSARLRGRACGLALILCVAGCNTTAPRAEQRCVAAPLDMSYQMRVIDVLHVYTGADGVSHAEVQPMPARESTYLGALLRQYPFGDPSNVVIVSGPPNFELPRHPAPYREVFVLLSGSTLMELSDGTRHDLQAGSVVLFEDTTGPGHGGRFGPCGYVAVDLQFKPPQAAQ